MPARPRRVSHVDAINMGDTPGPSRCRTVAAPECTRRTAGRTLDLDRGGLADGGAPIQVGMRHCRILRHLGRANQPVSAAFIRQGRPPWDGGANAANPVWRWRPRRTMKKRAARGSRRRVAVQAPGPLPDGLCRLCKWCGRWGECLENTIKSGRCGDWVWYMRGSKQCRRRWAMPMDPQTPAQQYWRALLGTASREYNQALTDAQQDACIAAGAKLETRPRLDQSGPHTGQQYWVRKRCAGRKPPGKSQMP